MADETKALSPYVSIYMTRRQAEALAEACRVLLLQPNKVKRRRHVAVAYQRILARLAP